MLSSAMLAARALASCALADLQQQEAPARGLAGSAAGVQASKQAA